MVKRFAITITVTIDNGRQGYKDVLGEAVVLTDYLDAAGYDYEVDVAAEEYTPVDMSGK